MQMIEYQKNLQLREKELEIRAKQLALKEKDMKIAELMEAKESLTEDDISLLKEKHHCLVHRGDIKGYSYICYSCGAFYYANCIDAIKEIENACWSCQSPIDSSMPAKSQSDTQQDVKIEHNAHKAEKSPYCPACGYLNKPGSPFCGMCGNPMK